VDLRRSYRGSAVTLVALVALLACAGPASASSLSLNGSGVLAFAGAAGEANKVTITETGGAYVVRDDGVASMSFTQTGGLPCSILSLTEVSCPSASVTTLTGALGDGDDNLTVSGSAPATVSGDSGGDTITGGAGADTISGGTGDETIVGGAGADLVSGGSGTDTVDYSAAAVPVAADLDGVADDGAASEGDNLATDVERLVGGGASDALAAGTGGTVLVGGGGADTLTGGTGVDQFDGASGIDQIFARDGLAEVVACGEDLDVVDFDAVDQLAADCERPSGGGGDGSGGGDTGAGGDGFGPSPGALPLAPDILLPAQPVTASSTPGVVVVTIGCAASAASVCMGEVILELTQRVPARGNRVLAARGRYVARQQRVGRRRYRVGRGKRTGARIRLNARGHAILRSRRRARGRIRIRQRDAAGRLLGETTRPISFTARKWGRRPPRRGSR
jgi:hypothetical protein